MNKKLKIILVVVVGLLIAIGFVIKMKKEKNVSSNMVEITPTLGSMKVVISSTGTVYPKNRLEIKPPVNGRVESVLVKEGETVKVGQVLAWMSSTERAALLDAASEQGEEKLAYWQKVYKPIPLKAPIIGEVIVSTIQAGQTVTTIDAVLVLSDELIVQAQVDETDIGKITIGQESIVTLDAYPKQKIKASVQHIYYESQTINNVIVYKIDLLLEEIPTFFRSGMSASIDFLIEHKKDVLMLPLEAIQQDEKESYVLIKKEGILKPVKQSVVTGIIEENYFEIVSGLTKQDVVLMSREFVLPSLDQQSNNNPFMPKMPRVGGRVR